MPVGSYTQLYIHLIFSPKLQCPIKSIHHQNRLYRYTSGILKTLGHKPLAINGMYDHIHIFLGMKPSVSISDTVKEIKRVSTNFMKSEFMFNKFKWQEGYGAFSYSKSQISNVVSYIKSQKEHHKIKTFKEEYIEFLEKFEIEYDPKYLFDFHED